MKEKISELFEKTKAEAVLLRNSSSAPEQNFFYFSELPFGHYSGSFLILKKNSRPMLLTTVLEEKRIPWLKTRHFDSEQQLKKITRKEFKGIKKIGLNFDLYPRNAFLKMKKTLKKKHFVDVSSALGKVRETKLPKEIARIKKAVKISEKAVNRLPSFFKKGMSEKKLAFKLEDFLRSEGDNDLPFPTIVASCKNSSVPHYSTGNAKIRNGILLIDFGAKYKNYCSDLTRTFCVGKASEEQRELYEKIFEAKVFAQKLCKPGASCQKIFEETNSFLKKNTHFGLIHGLGHGLGLQVHDFPLGFGKTGVTILKEKMVLTLEPAVYTKNFGIRIEDDILITRNGSELLSKAPKELIEL